MRMNRIEIIPFSAKAIVLAGMLLSPAVPCLLAQDANTAQQSAPTDADIQSNVAYALTHDAQVGNQSVSASTSQGIVTLSGTVQTEAQRQQAETIAATVSGVRAVQNSITVTGQTTAQAETAPPPPEEEQQQPAEDQNTAQQMPPPPPPDQAPAAARAPYQQPSYNEYPPAQPASGPVTVAAGTLLNVRLSEPLDTANLQAGRFFQATAASDVYAGNVLAIPRGAVLQGKVVDLKPAGPLGGDAVLQLQLISANLGGNVYQIASDTWSSKGPNKAGYTAGNTVGGAAVGAVIGAIIGRGTGAAVGAGVGAAAGLGASAATHGPRLYLPVETVLGFHLATATTVQPVSWQEAQRLASSVPPTQQAPRLVRRIYMAPPPYYGYPYPYYRPYYGRVYYGW